MYFIYLIYIIAIGVDFISLKEKSVIVGCFSVSLALLGIKAIYAIYAHTGLYFDIMLTSILITYISFISVIIGTVIGIIFIVCKESKISKMKNCKNFTI